MALQHLRSNTANKRPDPTAMADGQLAINTPAVSPGLFFKDAAGVLVKVGPVHVGTTAPNASPASGGTAGNSVGEQWLDTTGGTYVFKVWDGSAWRSESGTFVDASGDTMTGALGIIAGSASTPGLFFSGDTNTGIYSPGADQVAISTGGSGRLFVDASGRILAGTASSSIGGSGSIILQGSAGPGVVRAAFGGTSPGSTDILGAITFADSSHTGAAYIYGSRDGGTWTSTTSQPSAITFGTTPNGSGTAFERLRITSAGLVGVGTSTPSELFQVGSSTNRGAVSVVGGGATAPYIKLDYSAAAGGKTYGLISGSSGSGNFDVYDFTGSAYRLTITSSGNVGVGSTGPASRLTIKNPSVTGEQNILSVEAATTSSTLFSLSTNQSDDNTKLFNIVNGPLSFGTHNAERLRITSAGLVGIGTSSPESALDVRNASISQIIAGLSVGQKAVIGSDTSTGAYFGTLDNYDIKLITNSVVKAVVTSAGNVGIGTTGPQAPLDVTGTGNGGVLSDGAIRAYSANRTAYSTIAYNGIDASTNSGGLLFSINQSEAARIDSSKRLLVGTSTARSNFYNSTNSPQLQIEGNDNSKAALAIIQDFNANSQGGQLVLAKNNSTTVGSNVLVVSGDTLGSVSFQGNDGTEFVEGASITAAVDGTSGANDLPTRLVFSTTLDGFSSPTERMRITNDGFIRFGIAAQPSASVYGVQIGSPNNVYWRSSAQNTLTFTHALFTNSNGDCGSITTNGTSAAYNTSSDYRLKENVIAVTDGITRLQQLKPSRFNFIADAAKTVDGFLAHEAAQVVPECVTGEKDAVDDDGNPVYQGIDQSKLVPLLTAALQEAVAKIESLEARLTAAGI